MVLATKPRSVGLVGIGLIAIGFGIMGALVACPTEDDGNDTPTATLSLSDDSAAEAGSDAGAFQVALTNLADSNTDVVLGYTLAGSATGAADATAGTGDDYVITASGAAIVRTDGASGTLTVAAGDITDGTATVTITITPEDDAIDDDDETVEIAIGVTSPTGITVSGSPQSLTITDDDTSTATVSVEATNDRATEQGSDGEFTITLTGGTTTAAVVVPITLAITGDDAAHTDYALTATSPASLTGSDDSRSVTIPTGESSAILTVSAEDDADDETNETLTLTLGEGISGGGIPVSLTTTSADQSASVTIVDNDGLATEATIAASIAAASEGDTPTDGEFTISLDGRPPTGGVRVHFTISGTATAGEDWTAPTNNWVDIDQQPSRSATIAVDVTDDTRVEVDETVIVTLDRVTDTSDMTIVGITANSAATVTIADDDGLATEATIAATIAAASEDTPTNGEFTISLNGEPLTGGVRVHFTISGTATEDEDWAAPTNNWVEIDQQPSRSATIAVDVTDDTRVEVDETVIVTLARVTDTSDTTIGGIMASGTAATVTIADDDGTVSVSLTLDPTSVTEGDSGTTEQVLTITPALTFSETGVTLGSAVTISNLAIGSASTATVGAGEDYTITTALTPTNLTIAAGSGAATVLTGTTITLSIVDDANFEPDETIRFTADAAGTVLANAGTIGVDFTIINEDAAGIVSMAATTVSVTEGGMVAIRVKLNEMQSEDVVVVVTTRDGTASSMDLTSAPTPDYGTPDYTAPTGNAVQVTIPANTMDATVMIATVEGARMDSEGVPVPIVEIDEETFTVTIDSVMSGPGVLHGDSAMLATTVTITDNDVAYFAIAGRNTFHRPDLNINSDSAQENRNIGMRFIVARERKIDETEARNVGLAVAVPLRLSFEGTIFSMITNPAEASEDYPDIPIDFDFPAGAPAAGAPDMMELVELREYRKIDDDVVEGDEGIRATLAFRDLTGTGLDSGNLNLGVTSADQHEDYSLIPDGDMATLSVGGATVTEGETAMVPVTLSAPVEGSLVVTLTPSAGTATAGTDFPTTAAMLTLPNRDPRTTVDGSSTNQCPTSNPCMVAVPTTEDVIDDDDETFTVTLTFSGGPDGVSLGTATATVTITDDDSLGVSSSMVNPTSLTLPLSTSFITPGDGNSRFITLTVTLNGDAPSGGLTFGVDTQATPDPRAMCVLVSPSIVSCDPPVEDVPPISIAAGESVGSQMYEVWATNFGGVSAPTAFTFTIVPPDDITDDADGNNDLRVIVPITTN